MPTPVEVPKLGNTVEECLITRWAKHKGDLVSAGDLVAEIETDKATFEVTAPIEGTILETFFAEGALVPVFTNLFVIGSPGESIEPYRPQAAAKGLHGIFTDKTLQSSAIKRFGVDMKIFAAVSVAG